MARYLVVIPAGGKATRAFTLTGYGAILKPFINAVEGGATVMEGILKEADKSNIHEFVVIVSSEKDREFFERFFNPLSVDPGLRDYLISKNRRAQLQQLLDLARFDIHYCIQDDPRGFGDAVSRAYGQIQLQQEWGRPYHGIVVALGDDLVYSRTPAMKQLLSAYEQTEHMIVAVQNMKREDAKKYGVIQVSRTRAMDASFCGHRAYAPVGIQEKPESPVPSMVDGKEKYLAIVGRYVLRPADVGYLSAQEGSIERELDFTSLLQRNIDNDQLTVVEIDGEWHSVGSALDAQMTFIRYALGQYGQEGELGEHGKELVQHTLRVLQEMKVLELVEPGLYRLVDAVGESGSGGEPSEVGSSKLMDHTTH